MATNMLKTRKHTVLTITPPRLTFKIDLNVGYGTITCLKLLTFGVETSMSVSNRGL